MTDWFGFACLTGSLDKAVAALTKRAAIFELPACVVTEHPKKSAIAGTEPFRISHPLDKVSAVTFCGSDLIAVRFNDSSNVTCVLC